MRSSLHISGPLAEVWFEVCHDRVYCLFKEKKKPVRFILGCATGITSRLRVIQAVHLLRVAIAESDLSAQHPELEIVRAALDFRPPTSEAAA